MLKINNIKVMKKMYLVFIYAFVFPFALAFGQNHINQYEYWFDNNYAGKTKVGVTPATTLDLNTSIPSTGVNTGLHILHIRFKDDSSRYSSVISQFFQKLPSSASANKNIVAYEYWFDNNYNSKNYQTVSSQISIQLMDNLDASAITSGLHVFHIRFKDDGGAWSVVTSQFFQKVSSSSSTTKLIVAYEYWFDNNYNNKNYQTVSSQSSIQLMDNLDASSITSGLHVIHIRFKDDGGAWSTTLSQFFQKTSGGANASNQINAYEYWFDNNYSGKVLQTVSSQSEIQLLTSINATALNNGLHVFHVRFRDIANSWSSVNSSFFQKFGQSSAITNLMIGYRYWFDSADSLITNVKLASPVNIYLLNTPLNIVNIHKGNHEIHFQFQDTLKQWSSVTTDSMYKFPVVVADYLRNDSIVCDSGTVNFTNKSSIDADTFKWVFDDGTTSNLVNPSHHFNVYGIHPVKLIAYDTTKGVSDSITLKINVVHSPSLHLVADTAVCPPGLTLNAWTANSTYLWTGNSKDSVLNVTSSGIYQVTVTNNYGCSSTAQSNVTVNTLPNASATSNSAVCMGRTLNLSSGSGTNYVYNWTGPNSFSSSNQNPSITNVTNSAIGIYTVTVTNSNTGCSATAHTVVMINANPVATISSNSAICAGDTLSLFSGGGTNYAWSGPNSYSSSNQNPIILNATTAANGAYTVTVTDYSTGCSSTAQTSAVINSNPVATASSNKPCETQALNLSSGSGTNYTYSWSGPNSFNSTNQNPAIPNAATTLNGLYIVTVTNSLTGCSASAQTTVTVNTNPIASASSNSAVCAGHTLNLSSVSGTNYTYSWAGPNSYSSSNQNPVISNVTTASSGIYTLTVTNSLTSCASTDTANVVIKPSPVVNLGKDTTICIPQSITLDAGSGFASYNWNNGQTTQSIIVDSTGTYSVQVTNSYGCSNIDSIHVLVKSCAGIIEYSNNEFISIYPNPNNGVYFIKVLTDLNEAVEIEITDISGRLLFNKKNINLFKGDVIPVNNENYDSGTYLLYITSESLRLIDKIVISH